MKETSVLKLSSGISALDTVLGGGLPVGSLTVLAGEPGTGKTILALQICFANATPERKAVYYSTVAEPPGKFIANVGAFDFFDEAAIGNKIEFINLGEILESAEDGLDRTVDEIISKCMQEHPAVVVVDSAKALRDYVSSARTLRSAIYRLTAAVSQTDTLLILVGEYSREEMWSAPELSIADGIIEMVYEAHQPMNRRWLRIRKMRNAHHLSGQHPLQISRVGLTVYVRAEALDLDLQSGGEPKGRTTIGTPGLDEMTHGGLPRGGSTLILGPSGCGKTALSLRFIVQGLEDGERCLYVAFQENPAQLVSKAASFGWDLRPFVDTGQLTIYHVPEGRLDLDIVASVIRQQLAVARPERMVIDSLAEMVLAADESERFPAYARSLLGSLRSAGVSVVTTSETGSLGPMRDPIEGLSFLYHNVFLLRYIEINSEIGRAIALLKMRNSAHEKGIWRFTITDHGFEVLDKLEGVSGLLGWSVLSNSSLIDPSPASPKLEE